MPRTILISSQIENEISAHLKELEPEVLSRAHQIREGQKLFSGRPTSLSAFHGIIGGRNNYYTDLTKIQFSDFKDFYGRWLNGLRKAAKDRDNDDLLRYGRAYRSIAPHRLIQLLQDPIIENYTKLFLERNFYRNYYARTRPKPEEPMWSLWFGENSINWGLLIAPIIRTNSWTNDVSEIRTAPFHYWTIGHVLQTGFVDPQSKDPYKFSNLHKLMQFYRSVLKRCSKSPYEPQISDLYIDFILSSKHPEDEPFLIPELRFAGLQQKHEYRLDFSILNSHTMTFVGFEFSPASTHCKISGITTKTQIQINKELAESWAKEMKKRNDYFANFGITTITFTDKDVANVPECFEQIKTYLCNRPPENFDVNSQLKKIKEYAATWSS